jgi:hypothetical protein
MPKLLLINPINPFNIFSFLKSKFGKNNGVVFAPPIGLGYIAAVTPEYWQIKILDEAVAPFHVISALSRFLTAPNSGVERFRM